MIEFGFGTFALVLVGLAVTVIFAGVKMDGETMEK